MPCSSLEPLANQTLAGNTPVLVVDQSLTRAAQAFAGPMPAEAPEDSQLFYYYYEEDADDTQVRPMNKTFYVRCLGTTLVQRSVSH